LADLFAEAFREVCGDVAEDAVAQELDQLCLLGIGLDLFFLCGDLLLDLFEFVDVG